MSDYTQLRALAEAALAGKLSAFSERMHAALTPEVVLALLDEIEAFRKEWNIADIPPTHQEWAKIDPAVAFHLIERHAENWGDAGRMMTAWRDATLDAALALRESGKS